MSWLEAAEKAKAAADIDMAFICYWIAFNAAYLHKQSTKDEYEYDKFERYFDKIVSLDKARIIYNAIWKDFSREVCAFINNKYVFREFWRFQHGEPGAKNWESTFRKERDNTLHNVNLRGDYKASVLAVLFSRLYVLRNQLMHGGATWQGTVNRNQVAAATDIMASLVPRFINLMMESPDEDWGEPPYPVVDRKVTE